MMDRYEISAPRLAKKMADMQKEIESLRGQLDDMKRYAIEMSDDGEVWKRRAYTIWNRMPSFVEIPQEQRQWFEEDKDDE